MEMIAKQTNMKIKSKRGILLTLLVIVLFVLMLGEVMTFVVLNVNYSLLSQSAGSAYTRGGTGTLIALSATNLLHSGLQASLNTVIRLESSPSIRGTLFINNTQYFLKSLLTNGTAYGVNYTGTYIGSAIMNNFNGIINAQMGNQGVKISLVGSNVTVYQGSASTINATYTALAIVNTSSGRFTYNIYATTSVPLNGTQDIASLERANPALISISPTLPVAALAGGGNAASGSRGPFQFAYGTVIAKTGGVPTCNKIGATFQTKAYILVAVNARAIPQDACGMAGVITSVGNIVSTPWNVPYLIYPSSANILSITNGSKILLNGQGLATYNLSVLQSGIQNINYYPSQFVPSYLDQIQGGFVQRQTNGLFSFNLLNRQTPYFTDNGPLASNIAVAKSAGVVLPVQFTISFWINKNPSAGGCGDIIGMPSSSDFVIYTRTVGGCSAGSVSNTILSASYWDVGGNQRSAYNSIGITAGVWTQAAIVFSANSISWYVNGARVSSYSTSPNPPTPNANAFIIGSGDRSFNGSISNIQVYNGPLAPFDIQTIYRNGISGFPEKPANIIAWYPLNGNGNDYSSFNRNGSVNDITFKTINGYFGDPIFKNLASNYNTSIVEGVLNCQSINNCANNVPQLYLGNYGLAFGAFGSRLNESAALGLGNALLPRVLSFTQNSYMQEIRPLAWTKSAAQSYSVSIWVYPTSGNGIIVDEVNSSASLHDPWISLNNGVGDVGYEGTGSVLVCNAIGTVPLNTWSNIAVSFSAPTNTLNAYLNGANRFTNLADLGRSGNPDSTYYDLGKPDSTNCGGNSGFNYNGLMADFQVYNSALTANQALALYLNDTVNVAPITPANLIFPLSISPSSAAVNQTLEKVLGNSGLFYTGTLPCNVVSVTTGLCGLSYTPP